MVKLKVTVELDPEEIYKIFPPRLQEACDLLVKTIREHGVFDTEKAARTWVIIEFYKSMMRIAEEKKNEEKTIP
jgi:hypothetical protein